MSWKKPFRRPVTALLVVFISLAWTKRDLILSNLLGQVQPQETTKYAGHGNYNNEACYTYTIGKACEDVKIHAPSNTAFLGACGSPEDRLQYYPGAGLVGAPPDRYYMEYLTNVSTRLEIENWNATRDLVLHGLDIWQPVGDDSMIYIHAVNHDREGDSVVVFSHLLGTNKVRVVDEYLHPLIKTANEVAATGPRSFFVSNDHYFARGIGRYLENRFGPFKWASSIVFCADNHGDFDCQRVSPKNSHPYANGILLLDQGKTLAVADVVYGSITFYDVQLESGKLTRSHVVPKELGATPDNMSELSDNGDIIVAVSPNLSSVYARAFGDDPLDSSKLVEAAVVRLVKADNYATEVLYWDDGSLISIITAGAVDAKHGKLIASGVWERHFIVCDVLL
ncbi:Pon2 [Fonsecaea pedrosoi]|nr:Pon2 [Fonsecaea pedrosoi]